MIARTFLFLFLFTHTIQAQKWQQSFKKTKVEFKIKNFGVNVDGMFDKGTMIKTNFSSNNLENSFIGALISVKSIETGIEGRDKHILKKDYFFEEKHEFIVLQSYEIKKKGKNLFEMHAKLTIKGITKQLKIPLKVEETSTTLSIIADFSINRKEFNIGGGSLIMSKKVKIHVEYFGTKAK